MFGVDDNLKKVLGEIKAEKPNGKLYEFTGYMKMQGGNSKKEFGLSADNLVLRGSKLRGTEHVVGIVVYAGKETRVMQNSLAGKYKFSRLDK
jgi:magnesium-transporting ATPase (P-type)